MTMSWKLFFFVLKINDYVIKYFLSYIYLVYMLDILIYVYREYARTRSKICLLIFLLLLGLRMPN